MVNRPKKFKSQVGIYDEGYDMIEYIEEGVIQLAYEFNVYNLGDKDVEIQFNGIGDILILEPGEGFEINTFPIEHAVVKTNGANLKYVYWC